MPAVRQTTMAALKKLRAEPGLWHVPDAPIPTIGPRDVLIAVTHAGVCGTDRHIYEWDDWAQSRIPIGITTGHEFVGKVVAVGDAVQRVQIGQRVSGEGHIGCGVCQPCRTGRAHICENLSIIGVDRDGCFAQYLSLPEQNIWHVDPQIPDHIAAIFDPLGNAMHTVMAAGVSGRSVLITGVGIIGLMAMTIAKAAGAGTLVVSDLDDRRLEIARRLGADLSLRGDDPAFQDKVRQATARQGPEVLLEMSGSARALRQGFAALRNGGTVALLGLPSKPVELDLPNDIIFKGATVLGINGRLLYQTWFQVESFLLSGRLKLDPIVTHQLPLEDFQRAFKLMQSGEAIKVVLTVPQHDFS